MKRVLTGLVLAVLLAFTPATASALYTSSYRSYSSPSYRSSYSSRSYSSRSYSSSSSKSSSSSSSYRSYSAPKASLYRGTTYYSGDHYYNTSGWLIWYFILFHDSNNKPYYKCYDENHNEITCNRQPKTVTHDGQTYYSSDKPYKNTFGNTVMYYQQKYDTNTGKVKYYVCFDSNYQTITCNRAK